MSREPFWEKAYRDGDTQPFGPPSPEVLELLESLRPGAHVLDLGCGDGRNALPLARAGLVVTAVDVSHAACERLRVSATDLASRLDVIEQDLRCFDFPRCYAAVIAHGVLHLLARAERVEVLDRMKSHTLAGGTNVVAVFTNRLPAAPDLKAVTLGLLDEGELFAAYRDWDVVLEKAYTLHDDHPGGIRHEHAVNKIVARRPS